MVIETKGFPECSGGRALANTVKGTEHFCCGFLQVLKHFICILRFPLQMVSKLHIHWWFLQWRSDAVTKLKQDAAAEYADSSAEGHHGVRSTVNFWLGNYWFKIPDYLTRWLTMSRNVHTIADGWIIKYWDLEIFRTLMKLIWRKANPLFVVMVCTLFVHTCKEI